MSKTASQSQQEIVRHILGEAWTSDDTYRNLVHLCDDLGSRFGGSESEHQAAAFLAQRMREYGLRNVHLEEFPMYGWERGTCFLAVTAPVERSFSAIAMPYTGTAQINGHLIDVGEGEAPDFQRLGDAVRGKVVLTDAETNRPGETKSHRTDKYRRAVEAGASACVFLNRNPGMLHITGALYARNPGGKEVSDHEAPIPGIGISFEAGEAIRRLLAKGPVSVRIRTENRVYPSHSANVVGEIPGGAKANEIVLLGGHYDGHDVAQGAADNAAGAVVGLEVGRLLAPFAGQLERTVRVLCFGCEEIGLLGSWHDSDQYAEDHQGETLRLAINLDGAGRAQGGNEQLTATANQPLADYFAGLAEQRHLSLPTRTQLSAHSDNFPYFLRGYPVITIASRDATAGMIGRGYGHTEADTVDKVHLRGLQSSAAVVAQVVVAVANDPNFPGERRGQEQVREILEQAGKSDLLEQHWGRDNRAE